jgi:hypothetical protein
MCLSMVDVRVRKPNRSGTFLFEEQAKKIEVSSNALFADIFTNNESVDLPWISGRAED